jgi:C4-dicarboxylate transporter
MEELAKKMDIRGAIVSLVVAAFGFVAALFWRDAIKAFIDELIPAGQGTLYQFAAAVVVTIIAVIVIYLMAKINK